MDDLNRIDQLISDMRASYAGGEREAWTPTETHPVKRKWEIKQHNQRLDSLANQVKLTGGSTKDYGYRD